jgi:BASS family bile acid:Na+ symporter
MTAVSRARRIIFDRNLIFTAAFVLGLLAPGGFRYTLPLLLPILGLVITVSTLSIGTEIFRSPRVLIGGSLAGIGVNYVLMSGIILIAGALLVSDPQLRIGFILVAAVPSAIAVVPFSEILGGDTALSLFGMIGSYVSAFVLLPLVTILFIGSDLLDPKKLAFVVAGLIVVPLIVSRIARLARLDAPVGPHRGAITNVSLGIAFYTMVSANHDLILHQTSVLLTAIGVGAAASVLSGGIACAVVSLLSCGNRARISLLLLATLKNYALSAGIGIFLFSERAALPSVVMTMIMIPYILILDIVVSKSRKKHTGH